MESAVTEAAPASASALAPASASVSASATGFPASHAKTYIVEHLDAELGPWSYLEYAAIVQETQAGLPARFCLSSVTESLSAVLRRRLGTEGGFSPETRSVEELYPDQDARARVCLLDPAARKDLSCEDGDLFDVFLFGGILGDDPPRDRTSILRHMGFEGRRLGSKQMTTDTAVRVTRMVVEAKVPLQQIPFVDHPKLRFNSHESAVMPFRYVRASDGGPVMPQGMWDLIHQDADKTFSEMF